MNLYEDTNDNKEDDINLKCSEISSFKYALSFKQSCCNVSSLFFVIKKTSVRKLKTYTRFKN